ncbi:hypothetical protein [Phytobacter massiliensis]|uniref:hypothetical protein n=1 Tax=Phytobacter massiliensis TaxID=1485952 RepID=UPI000694B024|nr:hypothetical protein [Phytobacter massiliensis]
MNNNYGIPENLFNGTIPPGSLSWTLPTLAGKMLVELEERYGPRDKSWTFLGVEFKYDGPMIWYPKEENKPDPKHVVISLSGEAFSNHKEAMYQLSHECVHLLSPQGKAGANVLEEGLAKLYSMEIIERLCGHPPRQKYGRAPAYEQAAGCVRQLLKIDGHAIRKLRGKEPAFYEMVPATFTEAGLGQVPQQLIDDLLTTFLVT